MLKGTEAVKEYINFCSIIPSLGTKWEMFPEAKRKIKKEAVKYVSGAPWNSKLMA